MYSSVVNLAVFPRIWGCFLWSCVFFKTCVLLVLGLFCLKFAVFLSFVFYRFVFCGLLFFKFMALLKFKFTAKAMWACFSENLLSLGLFLLMCLPAFLFNFPVDCFCCWLFLPNPCWACFSVKLPILGFFQNTCLFLQSNLASLMYIAQQLLNADILAGNAARQWLLIAESLIPMVGELRLVDIFCVALLDE